MNRMEKYKIKLKMRGPTNPVRLEERAEKLPAQTVKGNPSSRAKHKTVIYQENKKGQNIKEEAVITRSKSVAKTKKKEDKDLIFHVVLIMLCIPEINSNYIFHNPTSTCATINKPFLLNVTVFVKYWFIISYKKLHLSVGNMSYIAKRS